MQEVLMSEYVVSLASSIKTQLGHKTSDNGQQREHKFCLISTLPRNQVFSIFIFLKGLLAAFSNSCCFHLLLWFLIKLFLNLLRILRSWIEWQDDSWENWFAFHFCYILFCVCVMFISVFRSLSLCLVESHLLKEIRGANKWRSFRDVSTARQIMDLWFKTYQQAYSVISFRAVQ